MALGGMRKFWCHQSTELGRQCDPQTTPGLAPGAPQFSPTFGENRIIGKSGLVSARAPWVTAKDPPADVGVECAPSPGFFFGLEVV